MVFQICNEYVRAYMKMQEVFFFFFGNAIGEKYKYLFKKKKKLLKQHVRALTNSSLKTFPPLEETRVRHFGAPY